MVIRAVEGSVGDWSMLGTVHLDGRNMGRVSLTHIMGSMLKMERQLVLVCNMGHYMRRVRRGLRVEGLSFEVFIVR